NVISGAKKQIIFNGEIVDNLPGDIVNKLSVFATCEDFSGNFASSELPISTHEEDSKYELITKLPQGVPYFDDHFYRRIEERGAYTYLENSDGVNISAPPSSTPAGTHEDESLIFVSRSVEAGGGIFDILFNLHHKGEDVAELIFERQAFYLTYHISRIPLGTPEDPGVFASRFAAGEGVQYDTESNGLIHAAPVVIKNSFNLIQDIYLSVTQIDPFTKEKTFFKNASGREFKNLKMRLALDDDSIKISKEPYSTFIPPPVNLKSDPETSRTKLSFNYSYSGAPLKKIWVEKFDFNKTVCQHAGKDKTLQGKCARGEEVGASATLLSQAGEQNYIWSSLNRRTHLSDEASMIPYLNQVTINDPKATKNSEGIINYSGNILVEVGAGQTMEPVFRIRVGIEDYAGNISISAPSGYLFQPGAHFRSDNMFASEISDRCSMGISTPFSGKEDIELATGSQLTPILMSHSSCLEGARRAVPVMLVNLGKSSISIIDESSEDEADEDSKTKFIKYLVEVDGKVLPKVYTILNAELNSYKPGAPHRIEYLEIDESWFMQGKRVRFIFDSNENIIDTNTTTANKPRIYGASSIRNSCYKPVDGADNVYPSLILQSKERDSTVAADSNVSDGRAISFQITNFGCN
ncbi:MAG: hypothetical protein OXT67_02390, partial [Zetaproteobacteria bacterium]|nr:hypothetical protein [Zetaproteobacteria bacterium]